MTLTAELRLEHEAAALDALRRMDESLPDWQLADGARAVHVCGWAPHPLPSGWSVTAARLACQRLARRGAVVKVQGAPAWRLP